jgi:hypothetical protein
MKTCFVLVLLLSAMSLRSQSFFDSGVYYLTIAGGHLPGECCSHSYYRMLLDSTANDTEYYSMSSNNRNLSKTGVFHVRANFKVINKRVYAKRDVNGPPKGDFLIYDFNLGEGDSARVNGFGASVMDTGSLLVVDSIRDIKLGPFIYKAQYVKVNSRGFPQRFVLVEHIGSLENGVEYYYSQMFEAYSHMINLCRNDTLLYWEHDFVVKSGGNTCSPVFVSGISEKKISSKPFVYPNPSAGIIQIQSDDIGEDPVLEIYNMSGQLLRKANVKPEQEVEVGDISPGIYLVKLLTDSRSRSQVLVIE